MTLDSNDVDPEEVAVGPEVDEMTDRTSTSISTSNCLRCPGAGDDNLSLLAQASIGSRTATAESVGHSDETSIPMKGAEHSWTLNLVADDLPMAGDHCHFPD